MQKIDYSVKNIDKVVAYLKKGGIVIQPTDTCYGIAADITNEKAVEKVCQLKKMSAEKPISILVSDLEMLRKYGELNPFAQKIAKKYLPGSLTLLIAKTQNLPQFYAKNTDLIGMRLPNHCFSLKIVEKLGNPITTTSANLTGKAPAYTTEDVVNYFGNQDILFFDAGTLPQKEPSTIIKILENSFEIVRQGDLLIENL